MKTLLLLVTSTLIATAQDLQPPTRLVVTNGQTLNITVSTNWLLYGSGRINFASSSGLSINSRGTVVDGRLPIHVIAIRVGNEVLIDARRKN